MMHTLPLRGVENWLCNGCGKLTITINSLGKYFLVGMGWIKIAGPVNSMIYGPLI